MKILLKFYYAINFSIKFILGSYVNENKLLKSLIKNNEIIYFDVGSNVGNDIKKINKAFRNRTVLTHAFEPSTKLCEKLSNISKNIQVNNVAVSNQEGNTNFYERRISSQSSIFSETENPLNEIVDEYTVKVINLDDYIINNNIKNIDFLKIDTEGNDYNVLLGLQKSLNKNLIKIIKIECLFKLNKSDEKSSFDKIYNLMVQNNYTIYSIPNTKHIENQIFLIDIIFVNNSLTKVNG